MRSPRGRRAGSSSATRWPFEGYTGGGNKDVIDGLMSSGDVGHFDDEGRLFIDGRDDEMIVSGGENVFPREVEDLLADHDAVDEAAVIGVEDEEFGQRLKAFVVLDSGKDLSEDDAKKHVKSNLAGYKVAARGRVPRRAAPQRDRQDPQARAGRARRGRERPRLPRPASQARRPSDARSRRSRSCGSLGARGRGGNAASRSPTTALPGRHGAPGARRGGERRDRGLGAARRGWSRPRRAADARRRRRSSCETAARHPNTRRPHRPPRRLHARAEADDRGARGRGPRTCGACASPTSRARRCARPSSGAGEVILEVVENARAPEGPAAFWGVTFCVADLDAAPSCSGRAWGRSTTRSSPGRRIATARREAVSAFPSLSSDEGARWQILRRDPVVTCARRWVSRRPLPSPPESERSQHLRPVHLRAVGEATERMHATAKRLAEELRAQRAAGPRGRGAGTRSGPRGRGARPASPRSAPPRRRAQAAEAERGLEIGAR